MEIKHKLVTDNFYESGKAKVVAEQQLDLGRLGTDACQWEEGSSAYESVSLSAPHVSVSAHQHVPGVEHGWTNASVHRVVSVKTTRSEDTHNPKYIVIKLSDGSSFTVNLFWEAGHNE